MIDVKKIREAVIKNRGGWDNATDGEIQTVWQSLPAETQEMYLNSVQPSVISNQRSSAKLKTDN
jgi:hypothetical protein